MVSLLCRRRGFLSLLMLWLEGCAALPFPLGFAFFFARVVSISLFLLGCSRVAAQVFTDGPSRWGAVLLAACCFTLPGAGTSLCIMDPCVTARSFSMPLSLFAIAAVMGKQWMRALAWLALTALVHPLMAAYAGITMLVIALPKR